MRRRLPLTLIAALVMAATIPEAATAGVFGLKNGPRSGHSYPWYSNSLRPRAYSSAPLLILGIGF
jgi:hypothetical protein